VCDDLNSAVYISEHLEYISCTRGPSFYDLGCEANHGKNFYGL
jgi:hypothetical protein